MPEEQEVVLRVVLDDQATAGLSQLQQQMRQLGSGPQAQGMERMKRGAGETGGAVKDLGGQLGAFAQVATGAAAVATGIIAAKVIDLGAAFVASIADFKSYADALLNLEAQAYAAGTSMAQFQSDVDAMVRSGVSAESAAKQITEFGRKWAEFGDVTSQTRQKLVQGLQDDPASLMRMQQFLDEAATMTRQGAFEAAKEFAVGIREYWREQGRPEAYGAQWEEDFLRNLGIPDAQRVRGIMGEISAARRSLFEERVGGAAAYQTASSEISEAWRDIKTSFQAILVDSPLVQGFFQGMASAMRGLAGWVETAETALRGLGAAEGFKQLKEDTDEWIKSMEADVFKALVDDFQYFVDQVGGNLKTVLPESWHDAIDMMTEGINNLIDDPSWSNLYEQIRTAFPESWRDALDQATIGITEWMDEIKRFFSDPNWLANATTQITEFVSNAAEGLYDQTIGAAQRAIAAMVQRMTEMLPAWARRLLGIEGAEVAPAAPRLEQPAAAAPQLEQPAAAAPQLGQPAAAPEILTQYAPPTPEEMAARQQVLTEEEMLARGYPTQQPIIAPAQVQRAVMTQMGGLEPGLGVGEGVVAPIASIVATEAAAAPIEAAPIEAAAAPIEAPAEAATQAVAPAPARGWRNLWGLIGGGGEAAPEARQEGGPVIGGEPYVVGERGPEIVVPQAAGDVASTAEVEAWSRGAPDLGPSASGRAQQTVTDQQFATALKMFNPFGPVARLASGAAGMSDVAGTIGSSIKAMGGAQSAELAAVMGDVMTAGQMGRSAMGALQGVMPQAREDGQRGEWAGVNLANLSATLDRAATQNVNVTGSGKISVDVNAPPGTHVGAQGEGLFKTTEITRMTQMLPAESGPLAATGIGAAAGVMGGASG